MPGPWEKYQTAPDGAGPWSKFKSSTPAPEEAPQVLDETHPELPWTDRMIVKNLAENNNVAISYLSRENPSFEFRDHQGEIILRKRGEKEFRRLDPSGFDLADVTDVGGGIAQTIGGALGAAGGGLLGTLAGPGPGNVVGATLGGAAASGGVEALRQKLAQEAGLQGDFNTAAVVRDAAFGAVPGVVKGVGAVGGKAIDMAARFPGKIGGAARGVQSVRKFLPSFGKKAASDVDMTYGTVQRPGTDALIPKTVLPETVEESVYGMTRTPGADALIPKTASPEVAPDSAWNYVTQGIIPKTDLTRPLIDPITGKILK